MILARVGSFVSPWAWHAHPEVWLIMGGSVVLFFLAVRHVGPNHVPEGELVITRRQLASFVSGVAFLWLFADWPVHDLSERYLYSVHMVQHMVFILVAPPLLILGTPQWLQRWILQPKPFDFVARKLCRPVVAAVIFNVAVAVSHAPGWVNFTLEHDSVHFFAHLFIFATAMIMWFPVVNTMPDYPTMGPAVKLVYLFIQSILPNVPVAFLAFSNGVIYTFYARVPRPFPISAVEDQQLAAAIMKVGGTFIIWSVMLVVFFSWYRDEHGPMSAPPKRTPLMPEVLTWDDVERELARVEPAQPSP
ncbi:MAG: putative rane protein [Acidimicrobiaceae bacterium]|jgi:putative membrane protein|nr:putative rane protein [Acidimicrobiaceae bacterium]